MKLVDAVSLFSKFCLKFAKLFPSRYLKSFINFPSPLPPPPPPPFTHMQVASMRKELEELQPKLVTAQEENAKMMVVIEKENIEVEARSKVVKKDEAVANEKAAEAQALKDEVMMMS